MAWFKRNKTVEPELSLEEKLRKMPIPELADVIAQRFHYNRMIWPEHRKADEEILRPLLPDTCWCEVAAFGYLGRHEFNCPHAIAEAQEQDALRQVAVMKVRKEMAS